VEIMMPGNHDVEDPSVRCRDHETLTARGWLSHYNESLPSDQHVRQTVAITYGKARIRIVAKRPIRDDRHH
jgi:hypothetical protein